jgi:predicted Zn-dependent protease with MMP-like domain
MLEAKQIIMNFNTPPTLDDLASLGGSLLEVMPEELLECCSGVAIRVEEFPDEATEQELNIDDPYDLLALYRKGSEIAPGVLKKTANDDDVLILFRRPILDMWCENQDDLSVLLRQVMIEEIAKTFDFSDDQIDEMSDRHFQGLF